MALLFSNVTIRANGEEAELLIGGIPKEYDDLEGWSFFDYFMEDISEEAEVNVHAEACLYGGGEAVRASPEEVAYLTIRRDNDPRFLADHCTSIENVEFSFSWSPAELFGMEMKQ